LRKSTDKGPIPRRLRFGAPQESHFQRVGNTARFNPAGNRSKKEIALIGDSMNTAARIQEACRATGCRVLASAALIERIAALPAGVTCRSLGPLPMRGKEQPIALYAFETVDGGE